MRESDRHEFAEGQVWNYRVRPGEDDSTALISKIEVQPELGDVYHVSVLSVHLCKQQAPHGEFTELPHIPVSRKTLELSVTTMSGHSPANKDYLEGYETWRKAVQEEGAGIFSIPLAEIINFIESVVSH